MLSISELCGEHRQLDAQTSLLRSIVAAPVPDAASVAALRWQIAEALHRHSLHEDRDIYRPILASGDAEAIRFAWNYRREHSRLEVIFTRYLTHWPVARITREWDAFRAETNAVVDQIGARMAGEEATLYAHAERVRVRRAA